MKNISEFPDDNACLEHLFNVRFGQRYECPKCGNNYGWYALSKRKAYSCSACGYHLYPCAGTIFHGSRAGLRKWLYAIYLYTNSITGVSAPKLQEELQVSYKCAFRMTRYIRNHMIVNGKIFYGLENNL